MKDTYPNKVGLAPATTAGSGNAPALIFNELMNLLIKILVRLGLLKRNLDYHLVRASMVIIYFFFGYQKWFPYEAQGLIPFFKNGPLISWMYPVFGVQGASWFLGVSEWLFGALLFLGFWNKKLGVLGALGSCVTFIMTITIIPYMPDGWNGMMVIVMIKVTQEPKAPRTPNFLFQKPKNRSAPNNHSETPKNQLAP